MRIFWNSINTLEDYLCNSRTGRIFCALHLFKKSLKINLINSLPPLLTTYNYIILYFSGQPRDFLPNFRHQRHLLCPADTNIASLLENFHNSQVTLRQLNGTQQTSKNSFQKKTKKSPCSEDLPTYTFKHLC